MFAVCFDYSNLIQSDKGVLTFGIHYSLNKLIIINTQNNNKQKGGKLKFLD